MNLFSKLFKSGSNIKDITAQMLMKRLDSYAKFNIVDVRTKEEFKNEHISQATNIDVFNPSFEYECQAKFEKSIPIILYCRSGKRSLNAARKLEKIGFQEIYNLKGGMLAWSSVYK